MRQFSCAKKNQLLTAATLNGSHTTHFTHPLFVPRLAQASGEWRVPLKQKARSARGVARGLCVLGPGFVTLIPMSWPLCMYVCMYVRTYVGK